ncbi:MAG: hypothetical protein BIFFINMI_01689 [Phycisphaerae bacterium]|nr:hypothetical protein [Phycisphaerae bacterium]
MTHHPLAVFDVDCLQLNESGNGLELRRPDALPAPSVRRAHAWIGLHDVPLVFTTCCSGRMLPPDGLPGVLFVPLDGADRSWESLLGDHRRFYIQKKAYGDPKLNYACQAFDMFASNANAARLVRALGVEQWVVFGNAFDLCVNAAARGLLALGQRVRVLEGMCTPAATGYGPCGTSENRARIVAELAAMGAEMATLDDLLATVTP